MEKDNMQFAKQNLQFCPETLDNHWTAIFLFSLWFRLTIAV